MMWRLGLALIGLISWSAPIAAKSESDARPNTVPITSTEILVKRHLRSDDGNIFIDIYTGSWKSHGWLYIKDERFISGFEGFQKGSRLTLKSFDAERGLEAPSLITFDGDLDVISGRFVARWQDHRSGKTRQIQFRPNIEISNRPTFEFKLYGYRDDEAYRDHVTRIDVIDKDSRKTVQRIMNFDARSPFTVYYEDINFDGYFDLRMSRDGYSESQDNRYYYWLYDPRQSRFSRSAEYEKMLGFLDTGFWCRELRFTEPDYAEVLPDGSISPKASGFCRPWDVVDTQ